MLSETFALNFAVVAGHGFFLETTTCLPDNDFAGSSRRKLWWILAPVGVDALAGVFYCTRLYLLGHEVKTNICSGKY
jgi:hypothetical protein